MALPSSSPRPAAPQSDWPPQSDRPPQSDWVVQVADTIESVVGAVRDKTTVPLQTVARAVVYGILMAVMGGAALVLATATAVRAGTYLAPVWAVYAVLGASFSALGLFLWRKRRPPAGPAKER